MAGHRRMPTIDEETAPQVDQRRKNVIDDLKQQIHQLQQRLDQFVIDELKQKIQKL